MTSLRQIRANQLNATKSSGPRSEQGKARSRLNALSHGLTAETVVGALENAADFAALEQNLFAEYAPRSTTERELVARLASVLWRLRRSTSIETGLLQIQAELVKSRASLGPHRNVQRPEWYDELDVASVRDAPCLISGNEADNTTEAEGDNCQALAYCFLQVGRVQLGAFDTLARYETALWRQAAQLLFLLQPTARDRTESKT
jgi:hypothetical protein